MTLPIGDMILQTMKPAYRHWKTLFVLMEKCERPYINNGNKVGYNGEVLSEINFLHQAAARSGSSQKSKLCLLSKKS